MPSDTGDEMSEQEHPRKPHRYRMPDREPDGFDDVPEPKDLRGKIEPWLSALFQSEHLSLLVGNGFTTGVARAYRGKPASMAAPQFQAKYSGEVEREAKQDAAWVGRGQPNFEDVLRVASRLQAGLQIMGDPAHADWEEAISGAYRDLQHAVLETEGSILAAEQPELDVLGLFLLSFASRSSSRERLHLFTTNYDRLVEYGCEQIGLRILDRFVGSLQPRFRSSRMDIDLHYNPPGIRGEPRALEGVIKVSKLHGSLDWKFVDNDVRRVSVDFGDVDGRASDSGDRLVIYPNASKDVETSAYPYSELFRDFSAAICRPNSVLVTYGYGFGDLHINLAVRDMLTIPSTHLLVISYDDAEGRVPRFIESVGHDAQVSYLVGSHFGDIETLVRHYLPKPAIDRVSARRTDLLRHRHGPPERVIPASEVDEHDDDR